MAKFRFNFQMAGLLQVFFFFGSEVPLLRMHHDGKVGPFLNLVNLVSDFGVSSCKLRRLLTANEESELGP